MKKLAMIAIMLAITTLTVGTLAFEYSGQTAFAQVPPMSTYRLHVSVPFRPILDQFLQQGTHAECPTNLTFF